jgi:hypothetical protein
MSEFSQARFYILRTDQPFYFKNQWVLATRLDFSYVNSHIKKLVGHHQVTLLPKRHEKGLGDTLFQILGITPTYGNWTWTFGLQARFPTASHKSLGSGKNHLLPTLGFKYDLKSWLRGTWCGILIYQDFDVGGARFRQRINQSCIKPILNSDLPQNWFVTIAPEIRYNWKHGTWFVPFDIQVGQMITEKLVLSLAYKKKLVDDFPLYKYEVEMQIGYFF